MTTSPNLQVMVTLNVILNGSERFTLANNIWNYSPHYDGTYSLVLLQMIINPATTNLGRKKKTNEKNICFNFLLLFFS